MLLTGNVDPLHMWTKFGDDMSKRSWVMLDKTDRLTDRHYLKQRWPSWPTHICVIQPQWVNRLLNVKSSHESRLPLWKVVSGVRKRLRNHEYQKKFWEKICVALLDGRIFAIMTSLSESGTFSSYSFLTDYVQIRCRNSVDVTTVGKSWSCSIILLVWIIQCCGIHQVIKAVVRCTGCWCVDHLVEVVWIVCDVNIQLSPLETLLSLIIISKIWKDDWYLITYHIVQIFKIFRDPRLFLITCINFNPSMNR